MRFAPNVEFCTQHSCYREVSTCRLPAVPVGKWDTVLACEVIEHLEQSLAEETLDNLERACNRRVIISTPNWPYYRGGGDTMLGSNDLEAHLSYISREFLRARGYKLIGAVVRVIKKLKLPVESLLESLPRSIPSLGICLVAYKDMDKST
jgi:hypothetical protein